MLARGARRSCTSTGASATRWGRARARHSVADCSTRYGARFGSRISRTRWKHPLRVWRRRIWQRLLPVCPSAGNTRYADALSYKSIAKTECVRVINTLGKFAGAHEHRRACPQTSDVHAARGVLPLAPAAGAQAPVDAAAIALRARPMPPSAQPPSCRTGWRRRQSPQHPHCNRHRWCRPRRQSRPRWQSRPRRQSRPRGQSWPWPWRPRWGQWRCKRRSAQDGPAGECGRSADCLR